MTCFHPITVWQNTKADLYCDPRTYYKDKKVKFKYSDECENRKMIQIPCGRCPGCLLDRANMWATRCTLEAKQWKNNCVISLTYNDTNVHKDAKSGLLTLCKKDLQDFMKRLRYHYSGIESWIHPIKEIKENPIRYFACGEYGKSGQRAKIGGNPHFHVIFFNWKPTDLKFYKFNKHGDPIYTSKQLQDLWSTEDENGNKIPIGFVTVEDFTYNNACYVSRYVQKKAGLLPRKRVYDPDKFSLVQKIDERNGNIFTDIKNYIKKPNLKQEPEFIVMSRGVGIGANYWRENKEKIKRNKGIFLKIKDKVHLKPIPRYFKKLWETENYVEYYRFKYEMEKEGIKKKAEIIAQVSLPNGTTEEVKYQFYLQTEEKILLDKIKALKRNNFI